MPLRVLISGAGIAGPALAFHLSKLGFITTVVEKASSLLPYGQNVDFQGSAVTAIKKMGLLEEIRRLNTTEEGTQLIDPQGRPFACFPMREGSTASPTSEFEILRGDLSKVLYEATKDLPGVDYIFGTTISEVLSNSTSSAKVRLSNGEERECDLLVAADGQWSKVRKQCFPSESVAVVDKDMYSVYFTIPGLPTDNKMWNIYHALRSRILTLRPDPYGTARAMLTIMPRDARQKQAWQEACRGPRKMQEELVRQEFADAGWHAQRFLGAMSQAPDFYFQAIQQIKMEKWSEERVVCLGDAAHAPTPLTGMGTSLAVIGAYVLAGELSKLDKGEHPKRALEAYDSMFRPFVEKIQQVSSPWFFHPDTAWKRWLLQCLEATVARVGSVMMSIPWVAKRFEGSSEANDDGFKLPQYPHLD